MERFENLEMVTITVPKDVIKMIIEEKRLMAKAVDKNMKNMSQLFEKAEKLGVSKSDVGHFVMLNGIGSHIIVEVLEQALKEADKELAANVKN